MATIQLGKIKQVWRGTWSSSPNPAYSVDDLVAYTDGGITSTYIAVSTPGSQVPSSSGSVQSNWNLVAKGVADPIPAQSSSTNGKVLTSDGSSASWGTGFAGTHYLAYSNYHQHGTGVSVNGHGLSNGTADGQRDCIVINDNYYHTVTPAHNDDLFIIKGGSSVYINMVNQGTYGGLGIQSSTATNFSANRNISFSTGQHSWGNGDNGQGDHYEMWEIDQTLKASEMSLTVGTTYYIRIIAQVHSPNSTIYYNNNSGTPNPRSRFFSSLQHLKKVT